MSPQNITEKLRQFIGGHFHQDMDIVADSAEGVLLQAMEEYSVPQLRELSEGFEQYVKDHPDDIELQHLLTRELWCEYNTQADGWTARQWLNHVVEVLRQEAERRSKADDSTGG